MKIRLHISIVLISAILSPLWLNAQKKKDTLFDSTQVYLKQKGPFKKRFTKAFNYISNNSDAYPDYAIRSARIILNEAKLRNDTLSIAKSLYILGYGYISKENYVLALEYFFQSLPFSQASKDTSVLVNTYNSIGIAYSQQKQHKKASEYFEKVINLAAKKNSVHTLGISYNNLGIEYQRLGEYALSDAYLKKSYAIFEKLNNPEYFSTILMNRGVIRFNKGMYDSALIMYNQARELNKIYNKEYMSSNISNNLGELFYKLREYDSALFYLNQTLSLIDTINDRYSIRETYLHLSNVYYAKGNIPKAYYYLKKHNQVNNHIFNDENLKKSLETEANFRVLKKDNELHLLEEKRAFEKKQTKLIYIFVSIAGILLLIALGVAIFRFLEKKKANKILTEQKNQIEYQQREITDSINYARNIQHSILPSSEVLNKVLPQNFLFYKPRDIVGGDFYFVEQVGDRKYFAVIDCTGHGVPGGFMSILGYNGLQKCLQDFKYVHPGEILDNLSKILVDHFTQQGKQTLRDGMDMALCCLQEKGGEITLEFAGAHNPCWILRKKTGELVEIKANKQPIGYYEDYKPFTNHTINLEKGDTIYLFSDGYPDQFGGPSGKKFKYSQLKELLIKTSSQEIKQRGNIIQETFSTWKSGFDQLDDVCMLAVQV